MRGILKCILKPSRSPAQDANSSKRLKGEGEVARGIASWWGRRDTRAERFIACRSSNVDVGVVGGGGGGGGGGRR